MTGMSGWSDQLLKLVLSYGVSLDQLSVRAGSDAKLWRDLFKLYISLSVTVFLWKRKHLPQQNAGKLCGYITIQPTTVLNTAVKHYQGNKQIHLFFCTPAFCTSIKVINTMLLIITTYPHAIAVLKHMALFISRISHVSLTHFYPYFHVTSSIIWAQSINRPFLPQRTKTTPSIALFYLKPVKKCVSWVVYYPRNQFLVNEGKTESLQNFNEELVSSSSVNSSIC